MGTAHGAEEPGLCPHGLACPSRRLGPLHRVLPRIWPYLAKNKKWSDLLLAPAYVPILDMFTFSTAVEVRPCTPWYRVKQFLADAKIWRLGRPGKLRGNETENVFLSWLGWLY